MGLKTSSSGQPRKRGTQLEDRVNLSKALRLAVAKAANQGQAMWHRKHPLESFPETYSFHVYSFTFSPEQRKTRYENEEAAAQADEGKSRPVAVLVKATSSAHNQNWIGLFQMTVCVMCVCGGVYLR